MSVYLDNAATSFPKPEAVYAAVDGYQRQSGVAVGRGAYRQALQAHGVIDRCRKRIAQLFGAECPERIVFTFNGTDSLNLALHGLLEPGDHVVTSTLEHNSVLRPLREAAERQGVETTYVRPESNGCVDPARIRDALRPHTKLIALIHASNVTGALQPIGDVGQVAREAGVLFLTDAAQSAGHVPIDLNALPVDLLACPGHKGLLGPLGTGVLYLRPGVEDRLRSLRQGGTGSQSERDRQPESLPDKYEAGNHNALGLFGLEAAIGFRQENGLDACVQHERELTSRLWDGFSEIDGVHVYGPPPDGPRVGVVSISAAGWEPQVLATILDENFGIQTRAGLHCAPGVHKELGTYELGGTVRFSVGPFNTTNDVDGAVSAVREVVSS